MNGPSSKTRRLETRHVARAININSIIKNSLKDILPIRQAELMYSVLG
jgi:hypothetical protein